MSRGSRIINFAYSGQGRWGREREKGRETERDRERESDRQTMTDRLTQREGERGKRKREMK